MSETRAELTRYFVVGEIAEECESIVKCWANILGTRGLEANGGIDAACFAVDVCRHHIICSALGHFIWNKAHNIELKKVQRVILFLHPAQRLLWKGNKSQCSRPVEFREFFEKVVAYGKQCGSIRLPCSCQGRCWKHQ